MSFEPCIYYVLLIHYCIYGMVECYIGKIWLLSRKVDSDNDTRMLRLLGIEPAGNPNEGEGEREDWRQLTGFTGIGEERRRSNGNDEDGTGTTPRRTRFCRSSCTPAPALSKTCGLRLSVVN